VNTSPQEVRAYFKEMMEGPNRRVESVSIKPEPDALSVLYNDSKTAVAYGHSNDHYKLNDGTEFDQLTRWSATVVKKDGQWKVANVHISTDMFDNPILNLAVKKTAMWVGGLAGVVGLGLGFAGGWMLRRPRRIA
jgi:hypothetical protein